MHPDQTIQTSTPTEATAPEATAPEALAPEVPAPPPSEPIEKLHLYDMSPKEVREYLTANGQEGYRADQVLAWAYQRFPEQFSEMSNLKKEFRQWLDEHFVLDRLEEAAALKSKDGSIKYLWRLPDGYHIESVIMPMGKRFTLCVSSQVGCKMGCAFCVTGKMGYKRNLTPGEIAMQLLEVQSRGHEVDNIVLMGMGEPLDNWENLKITLLNWTNTKALAFTQRRITLSTVGLAKKLPEVLDTFPRLSVAVSLVAPTQELREEILPVARKYSLDELMETCRALPLSYHRRITFEYPVLHGTNDRPEDIKALKELLAGFTCKVNLIPFNPDPRLPFQRPPREAVESFRAQLERSGLTCTIRWSKALDVQGACGQLADRFQEF